MFGCAASGRIAEPASNASASSSSRRTRTPRSAASSNAWSTSFPVSSCCSRKYWTSSVRSALAAICWRTMKALVPSISSRNPERPGCSFAWASNRLPSVVESGRASAVETSFGRVHARRKRCAPAYEHHDRRQRYGDAAARTRGRRAASAAPRPFDAIKRFQRCPDVAARSPILFTSLPEISCIHRHSRAAGSPRRAPSLQPTIRQRCASTTASCLDDLPHGQRIAVLCDCSGGRKCLTPLFPQVR